MPWFDHNRVVNNLTLLLRMVHDLRVVNCFQMAVVSGKSEFKIQGGSIALHSRQQIKQNQSQNTSTEIFVFGTK